MSKLIVSKRLSTSDIAYFDIKRKIIELEYTPEQQLIEEELSANLSVSRTPLRHALYRLELEGLIIKQPNGRMHVAPITLTEVEEIYRVREVIEGLLAREATEKMTLESLHQLEDTVVLMKLAVEQGRIEHSIKYGSEFHTVLYSLSQNQTALQFMHQIENQIERYRRIAGFKNSTYNGLIPLNEHKRILDLIRIRDAEKVEAEMRAHIRSNFLIVKKTVEQYLVG